MNNIQLATSIEQSKKLLELGLDRKTSDMYYWCASDLRIGGYRAQDEECDIPAWSLSNLLELMPNQVICRSKYFLQIQHSIEVWEVLYRDKNASTKYGIYHDTLIEAAYNMVCWLIENGHINTNVSD